MNATIESKLTKHQTKEFRRDCKDRVIVAEVRYDDSCGNGRNSFGITAKIYERQLQRGEPTVKNTVTGQTMWLSSCGCQHEEIAKAFPELESLIKWHLFDSTGPMHYLANAQYHAGFCKGMEDGRN